jgi:hypothetical protein
MNIDPEIASKKFVIFSWARRALFCGWRVKVRQQEAPKMTKLECPNDE